MAKHHDKQLRERKRTGRCFRCKRYLAQSAFAPKSPRCRRCVRDINLQSNYGITLERYESMHRAQKGKCAICRERAAVHVDHCHETEKVRGILCNPCNLAIGLMQDDPKALRRALHYVRRGRK